MMNEIESLKSQLKEENKRREQDLEQLRQSVEQWAKDKMPTVQAIKTYMETLQSQRKTLVDLILELRDDLAAPKSPLWDKFNDALAKAAIGFYVKNTDDQ